MYLNVDSDLTAEVLKSTINPINCLFRFNGCSAEPGCEIGRRGIDSEEQSILHRRGVVQVRPFAQHECPVRAFGVSLWAGGIYVPIFDTCHSRPASVSVVSRGCVEEMGDGFGNIYIPGLFNHPYPNSYLVVASFLGTPRRRLHN